jgi:hypothetical protein
MGEAGLVVVAVIVGTWLLGSIVHLGSHRWGTVLQVSAAFVSRLGAAAVFAWFAIRSAERGGPWLALAALFAVLALAGFAISGLTIWALISGQLEEDRPGV